MHAPTCGLQLVLEHDGDVYACDHFVEPEYLLGSIVGPDRVVSGRPPPLLELVASDRQAAFGRA